MKKNVFGFFFCISSVTILTQLSSAQLRFNCVRNLLFAVCWICSIFFNFVFTNAIVNGWLYFELFFVHDVCLLLFCLFVGRILLPTNPCWVNSVCSYVSWFLSVYISYFRLLLFLLTMVYSLLQWRKCVFVYDCARVSLAILTLLFSWLRKTLKDNVLLEHKHIHRIKMNETKKKVRIE